MAKRSRGKNGPTAVNLAPSGKSETVSISEIKNGYLIEKSGVKRGKYYSEREYSAGRPAIVATVPASKPAPKVERPRSAGPSKPVALREVGYLRGQ